MTARPPPYPASFAAHHEAADEASFAYALRPPPRGLHTLHHFCPAVTSHSACLDVLLFRGVLLVAYAAADEVVIARGTDLHALRRITCPVANDEYVSAVAFRERDAAVVAAFGTQIVVFEGWSDAAKERSYVYRSSATEAVLDVSDTPITDPIVSLSWSADGNILCAVANAVVIWSLHPSFLPVKYEVHCTIPQSKIPTHPLALAAISPCASFLAVSGLYARIAYVFSLNSRTNPPAAEIVHGRSGIAALDWKRRGGGNAALMTADRDGTLRLWVRASTASPGVARGPASWMDEIARSPHVERTARAGATFLAWGGGGGVADDEGDARATNAAHPLLSEGTAPKPSRCYHWIVRVAGGDAGAWRVRGLDDRPRAEFARLEPGNGEPLVGMREDDDFRPPELPLKDVSVAAMKAVAPIPLTTSSQHKIGLVKSYAISNGERRLRSPEPPEPPNIAAIFVLAVRNGLPFLARYDICPTSTMPAVCRARVGIGHTSPVVDMITSSQSSCMMLASGGWLVSRGSSGDVLIWRTNVNTGAWESMVAVAALPGPQSAVTFAPPRTSSHNRWEIGVFSCDAALGSLRLFQFVNFVSSNDNTAAQDVQFARQVSICHPRNRTTADTVTKLIAMPLGRNPDPATGCVVAVFGLRTSGRLCVWRVSRYMKDKLSMEPSVVRVVGSKHATITCATSGDLRNIERHVFLTGGTDGSVFIYTIGNSETEAVATHEYVEGESEDEDVDEGIVWLSEVYKLMGGVGDGPVEKIELLRGGSRILASYVSGKARIWSRNSSETLKWDLEFQTEDTQNPVEASRPDSTSISAVASLGYDHAGNDAAVVLRYDGLLDRYKRALGMPWENVRRRESPQDELPSQRRTVVHIGKGVIVCGNGRGMTVLTTNPSDAHPVSFSSDAAGYYNPSKTFFALLLTGGRSWQVTSALDELHVFVKNVTKRKASEASYGSGRGLVVPPPSLSMLISERENNPSHEQSSQPQGIVQSYATNPFLEGRSIFAELMAKSDASLRNGVDAKQSVFEDTNPSKPPDLSGLSNRLRAISLAGLSRIDHSVLAAVARACASLRSTLNSLDVPGARYALIAACHQELSRKDPVPLSIVASAVHSSSSDALMDHFLPRPVPAAKPAKEPKMMWETARYLGAGWWVSTSLSARKLAERIARADFSASRRADDAALWYVVLGRVTALSALYRAEQNIRMSQFLQRDFKKPENKTAAGKNAYVLVSKHRHSLAVAFFILAGDIPGALSLVRTRIKDDQLAIFLSRILDSGEHLKKTLDHIAKSAERNGDDHRRCIVLSLGGYHELAIREASKARYPLPGARPSEAEKALTGSLPSVVHSLSHVLALSNRPQVSALSHSKTIVQDCRKKALTALLGDGSPVAALVVGFQVIRNDSEHENLKRIPKLPRKTADTTRGAILCAAIDALRGRVVCMAGAVRSGATSKTLRQLLEKDLHDLIASPMGLDLCVRATEGATCELAKEDEVDGALVMTYAALNILSKDATRSRELQKKIMAAQRNCLRVAVSRALLHVQGSLSLLHHPTFSSSRLYDLIGKYQAAMNHMEKDSSRSDIFRRLVLEFRGALVSLRFAYSYLKGDWPGVWISLRACEGSWQMKLCSAEECGMERDGDDSQSMTSGCSSLAPESVSVEALRHVASNPVILSISKSLGHIRRFRKTPSMAMVGDSCGAATISDDATGTPTLAVQADDPLAVIRIHPALSSTLSAASASYLAAHLAAHAAEFSKSLSKEGKRKRRNSQLLWQSGYSDSYDQSFRLMKASETLEQLAEDAIAQWVPLQRFGAEAIKSQMSQLDESVGAFVDLWSRLGCLPEYAPGLSEAATVAAAELAAAASKAAIEAAEQKDGGRSRRRRRERRGEAVVSVAKEGLKHFDTTSADSLHGAYPVRFSASASGPWSGRGKHATLYSEERALFRTLCLSSADPPAVIVATPKGIQEIVPSSYTTMPAGFRSHYSARKNGNFQEKDARLEALRDDLEEEEMQDQSGEDSFITSYDGFGEGPYVALDMATHDGFRRSHIRSSRERKAVWRHQVQATTLASHPFRRRFASGASDGVVRLWDFEDPISLAAFRDENFGRVSHLSFSAYGNTLMAVFSSGHVTIWDDPDIYSSHPRRTDRKSGSKKITAFDNRIASQGVFLDERHTIAVVGDPSAPPSVGHSLRIFDTRERHSSFVPSWSCAVNHQSEARCLTLLEDRMRVVTGGLDGSMSVVDIRTKACIAELPAHTDEVTCLALETPRGRALVSGCSNGEIKLWDSRTLLQLDVIQDAHIPTRHYWSGNGIGGLVGSYGTQGLALTDRSLISCGGDGVVKIWGPGWGDFDLNVL